MNAAAKHAVKFVAFLVSLLKKHDGDFSDDDFHLLRVEIKKMKALIQVIRFTEHDVNTRSCLNSFKKLFKPAGIIRDLSHVEQLLKEDKETLQLTEFISGITKQRKREEYHFLKLKLTRIRHAIGETEKLIPSLYELSRHQVKEYRQRESDTIQHMLLALHPSGTDLHTLRKRLKAYSHTLKILVKKYEVPHEMNKFLDTLGKWHDLKMINKCLMESFDSGTMSKIEIATLNKILTKIDIRCNGFLADIHRTRTTIHIEQ